MTIEEREIRSDLDRVIRQLEKEGLRHNDDYDVVGIGDVVESVLNKMGITQDRFKSWTGLSECNCTERKKWLNGILHWRQKRINGE